MSELVTYWATPQRLMDDNYPGSPDAATTTRKLRSILGERVRYRGALLGLAVGHAVGTAVGGLRFPRTPQEGGTCSNVGSQR